MRKGVRAWASAPMRFPVLCEPESLSRTATKSAERTPRALQTVLETLPQAGEYIAEVACATNYEASLRLSSPHRHGRIELLEGGG